MGAHRQISGEAIGGAVAMFVAGSRIATVARHFGLKNYTVTYYVERLAPEAYNSRVKRRAKREKPEPLSLVPRPRAANLYAPPPVASIPGESFIRPLTPFERMTGRKSHETVRQD